MTPALWQTEIIGRFSAYFEAKLAVKALILVGSNTTALVDPWSDVDLVCVIDEAHLNQFFPDTQWLSAFGDIFGIEQSTTAFTFVTRLCFSDFHRVDLVFMPESALTQPENWLYSPHETQMIFSRSAVVDATIQSRHITPRPAPTLDPQGFERMTGQFWFKATVAATKVMRNDLLIGLHLALDLARDCLVLAMIRRDIEAGTNVHRFGGPYNEVIEQLAISVGHPTAQGILALILQNALAYDVLALRCSSTYQSRAERFQDWIRHLQTVLPA